MRVLIIDNHDSFVHNITGLLQSIRNHDDRFRGLRWDIALNDEADPETALLYDALILSPGPGLPSEAGRLMETVKACAGSVPMLGICLGFQAIAETFGASLRQLPSPRHGHPSRLTCIDEKDPLAGSLAGTTPVVGRYHSWIVDKDTLPPELTATSFDEEGNVMSLRHLTLPVFGTQFHPESVITDCGRRLLAAFLAIASGQPPPLAP